MSISSTKCSVDSIINSMKCPTLTKTIGHPTFNKFTATLKELTQSASGIPSDVGDGEHSHLCLVLNAEAHKKSDSTFILIKLEHP